MRALRGLLLGLAVLTLGAEEPEFLGKLPAWAHAPVREAAAQAAPAGAEAWVLLQRYEVSYSGSGTLQIRSRRLVRVIQGKGLDEAYFVRGGILEGALKIVTLHGWNLRPNGELVKLEARDKFTVAQSGDAAFDRNMVQIAALPRVAEGSLVAFEAVEEFQAVRNPLPLGLLETHPVRRWELEATAALKGVGIQVRTARFKPWLATVQDDGAGSLRVANLPALPKAEPACPFPGRFLPRVEVRFTDPQWEGSRTLDSWDTLAGWYHGVFAPRVLPMPAPAPVQGVAGLQAIWRRLGRDLVYKQVYLTPDRGNVPETSLEVARRGYGDCKDLACLFLALARGAGFEGYPVLARMQVGPVTAGEQAGPVRDTFDHVIAALRLDQSLGLAAEVVTPKGRFLLVDPTDALTPLGRLGAQHRDGRVLLCLPGAGQWLEVPAAAVQGGAMAITLTGAVAPSGLLKADVVLDETGDHWGLRSRAHSLTQADLRQYLQTYFLDNAVDGLCEILSLGDPLDLDHPFTVKLRVTDRRAFTRQGSAWAFKPPLGLPRLPQPFTKAGAKRRLPVEVRAEGRTTLEGTLALPLALNPMLATGKGESAFRTLAWNLATAPAEGGCTVTFRVEERRRDAFFGPEQLEPGEGAWRKDRALVRSLLEDGLALRP